MDALAHEERQPSFLRATAQRAGALVLAPPRLAARALPRRFVPAFLAGGHARDAAQAVQERVASAATSAASSSSSAPSFSLPAPVTYLTSPYLFGTLALAFFLHRIRHLVPPRQSLTAHARNHNADLRRTLQRVLRPAVQVGVRAPGILVMLRVALACLVAIALARGADLAWLFPVGDSEHATLAGKACRGVLRLLVWSTAWAGKGQLGALLAARSGTDLGHAVAHDGLLWSVFLAASFGLTCETFVRALADDTGTAQPLNLLSFSFLLHVHTASARSDDDSDAAHAAAASINLYIYLSLVLLELVALQLSYCAYFLASPSPAAAPGRRVSPRRYRLPITAAFSLVQQFFALRSWAVVWGWVPATPQERASEAEQFGTVWLSKVPEVCFEVVVAASVAVKALAAALRGEELSFENLVGHPSMSLTSEEDFPVALIKYSTHLLSSTRVSGLALELHPLDVLPLALGAQLEALGLVDPPACGDVRCELHGAEARAALDPGGAVALLWDGSVQFEGGAPSGSAHALGLGREIRRVAVRGPDDTEGARASTAGLAHLEGERKSALWRFGRVVARLALYVLWRGVCRARGVARGALARVGWGREEWELERRWAVERRAGTAAAFEAERGTQLDGDEDEEDDGEWSPSTAEDEGRDSDVAEWEEDNDDEEDAPPHRSPSSSPGPEADDAPYALLADAEGELAPYLLAHQLARGSGGPLTRRRYRALLPSHDPYAAQEPSAALSSAVAARRAEVLAALPGERGVEDELEASRERWREERARFCVVCTVEERTIVLWPCRCLCLCEGCRASLADRTTGGLDGSSGGGGGGSLCPTCRSEVQGFSRIWVP